MKKHFLLLLMTLLPLATFAQRNVGDKFPAGAYVYQVTATMVGTDPGEVTLIGIRDNRPASVDGPIVSGALVIPGLMTADLFGEEYKFNVTALGSNALQKRMNASGVVQGNFTETAGAQKVTFPATIKALPAGCLSGYTNINSISFDEHSELETIADGAFATTQIKTFDFSNCSQLAALTNAVFVEASPAVNSYIETITLPESSLLLKQIGTAFQRLTSLKEIKNLEKSAITEVVADAFNGDANLTKVELPGTVQTIADNAFRNCGVADLTINVNALQAAGDGTTQLYGTNNDDLKKLTKLTLKGNLGGIVTTNAFKGHINLATLDLSQLNFASLGQIATSAFEGCTAIKSVTLGNINDQPAGGCTIDADAFKGCTKLATVTIGNINSANAIGAQAFGNKLKDVKIGTVKAGAASILADAFVYANVEQATLSIATGVGQYVSSDDAATPIFETDAFKFDAIDGTLTGWRDSRDAAVVKIGEIRSKGGVFSGGDISGKHIRQIDFMGNIAEGGLDAQIYDNDANGTSLKTLVFWGDLAIKAIEANAFANLKTNSISLTFKGSLAKEAILDGAFELLKEGTMIEYTGTPADATVNPFQKNAFDNTTPATVATIRDIEIKISNSELETRFKSATKGLNTDGEFDVYRVKFYVKPAYVDNSFTAFRNANEQNVAWTRWEFGSRASAKVTGSIAAGSNLKIQRVQDAKKWNADKDGVESEGKVKVTLYGTYTDEDDALNASTIYMVPLKVQGGYYYIPGTNEETLIAKVEKVSGNFSIADVKIPVTLTAGTSSVWQGLTNTELHVAQNIMTNQQLVDKNASDGGTAVDIYRGKSTIQEDLYIMSDPAKYNGFYFTKFIIEKKTDGTGAYINEGWYYMLLKHYNGAPAAARVVWMSDDDADAIFDVKAEELKPVAEGWYTIDGKKLNAAPTQRGLYIKNGKKIVVK